MARPHPGRHDQGWRPLAPKHCQEKLKLSWRKEIAKGYPGPIVSEDLIFTVETKSKNEIVRAFDRTSGEQNGNLSGLVR